MCGGGGGGQKQQEREKRQEILQVHYSLPAFTVLYNSRGERRRGPGMRGGSGGRGEKRAFFNLNLLFPRVLQMSTVRPLRPGVL